MIAFSPKRNTIAVNKGTHIELWNVLPHGTGAISPTFNQIGELMNVFILPSGQDYWESSLPLSFGPDGNMIAVSNGGSIVIWDITHSHEIRRFLPPKIKWYKDDSTVVPDVYFHDVAFSPDDNYLAVSAGTGVYLCSMQLLIN